MNETIGFRLWQIKGNALQGDVQPNCIINFILRFKLVRGGSITIEYSLPTSVVLGIVIDRLSIRLNFHFKSFRFLLDVILILMMMTMMIVGKVTVNQ